MPARLEIEGGVPLRGSVRAGAAKNAALPALAAALLAVKPVRLTNVPDLVAVRTMIRLVQTLGATVRREGEEVVTRVERVTDDVAPYELVSTMRMHVAELARMGARIDTDGAIAIIRGVPRYQGAPVMASDLPASAALVLAGLIAHGHTMVSRVYHLDRGYERLEKKLVAVGARIERRP